MNFSRYRFYVLYIIPLIICIHTGCNTGPEQASHRFVSKEEIFHEDKESLLKTPEAQSYRLWHTIDQFELNEFQFYGGFYEDRLKFYYSDTPDLRLGEAKVKLIMLYFLDDRLVKIRYHLDRNIENYLMDSLGMGMLDTKYTRKKNVYATEKSLKKLKDFNISKNDPSEYGISWDRYIILSSFHVNGYPGNIYSFDTISSKYVYVDQLKSYRKRLIEIENSRIARLQGDTSVVKVLF
jgi:hypothetical protein